MAKGTEPLSSLRICVLIPDFSDGGAQRQCIYLLNEWQKRNDISVTLITFGAGEHAAALRTDGLEWFQMKRGPWTLVKLASVIRRQRIDVVMSWLHEMDNYAGLLKLLPGRRTWVLAERNARYPKSRRIRARLALGRRADLVIANSASGGKYWEPILGMQRVSVIPNIVRTPEVVDKALPPLVVSVGRLVPQKNPMVVAQAMCLASHSKSDAQYAIIGAGPLAAAVAEELSRSERSPSVDLLGFRSDAADIIARAQVMVSMSRREGQPNVLLEAVMSDCVPVVSRIDEHVEVLGGAYPYYVDVDAQPAAVAEAICAALEESKPRDVLAYARGKLSERTAPQISDDYVSAFRRLNRI
ncbi:glycosyltransferase involved in cell wall biosynthesis [Microbacterium sp. SORGH_AS428]|uniref:glycosyltransferase n=1 Tax=Microbacterium sp. SORGH_AS_0428 TaxID=3041788 RepID=UPI002857ECDC|nr:glycosyltransferase [Microbacterium sp. SORGH_AS_0428]MDR6199298.1 glycosyltransferase involved in cell wall biosynthesis [Microbacterium sp. SORGH_AS_0428]